MLQVDIDRRPQAQQTWVELRKVFPARAQEFAAERPWLAEQP